MCLNFGQKGRAKGCNEKGDFHLLLSFICPVCIFLSTSAEKGFSCTTYSVASSPFLLSLRCIVLTTAADDGVCILFVLPFCSIGSTASFLSLRFLSGFYDGGKGKGEGRGIDRSDIEWHAAWPIYCYCFFSIYLVACEGYAIRFCSSLEVTRLDASSDPKSIDIARTSDGELRPARSSE